MASRENVLSRGKCGRAGNFDLQQGKRGEPCEVPGPSRDSAPGRTRGRATTSQVTKPSALVKPQPSPTTVHLAHHSSGSAALPTPPDPVQAVNPRPRIPRTSAPEGRMPENALPSHLWSHTGPSPGLARSSFPPRPSLQTSGQQAQVGSFLRRVLFIHSSSIYRGQRGQAMLSTERQLPYLQLPPHPPPRSLCTHKGPAWIASEPPARGHGAPSGGLSSRGSAGPISPWPSGPLGTWGSNWLTWSCCPPP